MTRSASRKSWQAQLGKIIILPIGIVDELLNSGLNVYPNPNTGTFKIQFLNPSSKKLRL